MRLKLLFTTITVISLWFWLATCLVFKDILYSIVWDSHAKCTIVLYILVVAKYPVGLVLLPPGAPLTYFNDRGGGVIFLGCEILAKSDFFWVCKRCWDFFGYAKKSSDFFG